MTEILKFEFHSLKKKDYCSFFLALATYSQRLPLVFLGGHHFIKTLTPVTQYKNIKELLCTEELLQNCKFVLPHRYQTLAVATDANTKEDIGNKKVSGKKLTVITDLVHHNNSNQY